MESELETVATPLVMKLPRAFKMEYEGGTIESEIGFGGRLAERKGSQNSVSAREKKQAVTDT